MIERIFQSSRLLVLIAVVATSVSALLLYGASLIILGNLLLEFVQDFPTTVDSGKGLAVKLLKLLDLLFIAITFQLIAVSLYRLFITPLLVKDSNFLNALNIEDFRDLKITLIKVAIVIMVILFLEHAVEIGATLETLYFGAAVAMVMFAAIFSCKNMK